MTIMGVNNILKKSIQSYQKRRGVVKALLFAILILSIYSVCKNVRGEGSLLLGRIYAQQGSTVKGVASYRIRNVSEYTEDVKIEMRGNFFFHRLLQVTSFNKLDIEHIYIVNINNNNVEPIEVENPVNMPPHTEYILEVEGVGAKGLIGGNSKIAPTVSLYDLRWMGLVSVAIGVVCIGGISDRRRRKCGAAEM